MILYQPTAEDIEWAGNMIYMIRDGGILSYPATKLVYKLDKTNKKMTLQNPDQLRATDSNTTHEQTKIVFGELGWTVETVGQL